MPLAAQVSDRSADGGVHGNQREDATVMAVHYTTVKHSPTDSLAPSTSWRHQRFCSVSIPDFYLFCWRTVLSHNAMSIQRYRTHGGETASGKSWLNLRTRLLLPKNKVYSKSSARDCCYLNVNICHFGAVCTNDWCCHSSQEDSHKE